MKRVFAYLRVSTAAQTDGDGFPRQKDSCRNFAEGKGWSIVRFFEEQQSGSDQLFDRPLMQELLALCGGGMFDTIIVERVDRIARDVVIAELFFRECKKKGVLVYAADSGEELVNASGDPTRTLIRQILGALAEWDKAQICKKLQAGRRRKKMETGKPCGGPQPYGKHKDLEVREREDWVLNQIVRQVRLGRKTFDAIARGLQVRGIPTPGNARAWTRGIVHHLFQQNKHRILPNDDEPHYLGFLEKFERAARRDGALTERSRRRCAGEFERGAGPVHPESPDRGADDSERVPNSTTH